MKSNYFYDMLLANAGNTIQAFNAVTLEKSRHTLDNIEYGEVVTDSLMEDIKYRQEKINDALEAWEDEIGTENFVNNYFGGVAAVITSVISTTLETTTTGLWEFKASIAENKKFKAFISESDGDINDVNGTGILVNVSLGTTDYGIKGTRFLLQGKKPLTSTFKVLGLGTVGIPFLVTDDKYDNGSEVIGLFTPTRTYTALVDARIATGQAVNGLDALVQANEEDLKNRLKAIQEYLFVRE